MLAFSWARLDWKSTAIHCGKGLIDDDGLRCFYLQHRLFLERFRKVLITKYNNDKEQFYS